MIIILAMLVFLGQITACPAALCYGLIGLGVLTLAPKTAPDGGVSRGWDISAKVLAVLAMSAIVWRVLLH